MHTPYEYNTVVDLSLDIRYHFHQYVVSDPYVFLFWGWRAVDRHPLCRPISAVPAEQKTPQNRFANPHPSSFWKGGIYAPTASPKHLTDAIQPDVRIGPLRTAHHVASVCPHCAIFAPEQPPVAFPDRLSGPPL